MTQYPYFCVSGKPGAIQFADQVRRLAKQRKNDPTLASLMMADAVTVEDTLQFMKRADAVK